MVDKAEIRDTREQVPVQMLSLAVMLDIPGPVAKEVDHKVEDISNQALVLPVILVEDLINKDLVHKVQNILEAEGLVAILGAIPDLKEIEDRVAEGVFQGKATLVEVQMDLVALDINYDHNMEIAWTSDLE